MAAVSDDAEQTPKTVSPIPMAPSPQMVARPTAPAARQEADDQEGTGQEGSAANDGASRFPSTGDPRIDRALAQLPDPDEHRREADSATIVGTEHVGIDHGDTGSPPGIDLPDPGLLDAHLAEVTSVHRQLQQRLSDLSG